MARRELCSLGFNEEEEKGSKSRIHSCQDLATRSRRRAESLPAIRLIRTASLALPPVVAGARVAKSLRYRVREASVFTYNTRRGLCDGNWWNMRMQSAHAHAHAHAHAECGAVALTVFSRSDAAESRLLRLFLLGDSASSVGDCVQHTA